MATHLISIPLYLLVLCIRKNTIVPHHVHPVVVCFTGDWDSAVTAVLSGRRVRLVGLLPATDYTLRPVAVTALGSGPPGRPVHVRTAPAPPSLAPPDLSLVPLTSTEVKVTWRPPPAESHHGQLTGYRVTYNRSVTSCTHVMYQYVCTACR